MSRAYVEGLRKADPMTLSVLAQDLIRKPLVKLDPRAICDLLALAENEEITGELFRDLRKFKDQMLREVSDLPDGLRLGDFLSDLISVGAARVPQSLRETIVERSSSDETPDTVARRADLLAAFEATEPDSVTITAKPEVQVINAPARKAPEARQQKIRGSGGVGGRAPAPAKDVRREAWIRDDVLERLSLYGVKGIKESILVAGALHRSPFGDLKPNEVTTVLKSLKVSGRVDLSKGRWAVKAAW